MRVLVGWLSQVVVVTLLNLRTIRQRLTSSLVAVVGIAGVVAVFVAVLSMAEGFRTTMATTGSPDTAIVMRAGTDSEMISGLSLEDTRLIADAAGVRRNESGPVASAELFVIVDLPKRSTNTTANVPLRGVGPNAFAVRPHVRIIEGRRFETGAERAHRRAGRRRAVRRARGRADAQVRAERVDRRRHLRRGRHLSESELWCDAGVLQPAYRRGSSFQTVYAKLESPEAFTRFKDALTTDPRLDVKVLRETDYFAEQSQMVSALITTLGAGIALLMGIGAVFGAINTMYTAVAARTREIATLRALGFGGGPVVVSVLVESLLLALVGGAIGGGLAYVGFNGFQTSTINWQTFSQVAFAFAVTPALIVAGMAYALLMGLVGGLLPAVRAARLPIVAALREL